MKNVFCFLIIAMACFAGHKESYNEANKFYRERNFAEAEIKYTEAIEFEDTVEARLWRGKSRFELSKFEECMDDCHYVILNCHCLSWMGVEASKYIYYCLTFTDPENYWLCTTARKEWLRRVDSIKFEKISEVEAIISNIKNEQERRIISNIFTDFNYSVSPQEGGNVVIKKKCKCGCNEKCFESIGNIKKVSEETCKKMCTSVCYAFNIALFIYRDKIPGPCSTVLSLALDYIEEACQGCCEKEEFWKHCYEDAEKTAKDIGKKIDEWINKPDEKVWPTDLV